MGTQRLQAAALLRAAKKGDTVRVVLLSAVLLLAAACEGFPPPLLLPPPPQPIVLDIAPPSLNLPGIAPVPAVESPSPPFFASVFGAPGPSANRLTLSNFIVDRAHVVALVTSSPDCSVRGAGDVETNFTLKLNGTRIVEAPPGADICWRYELEADDGPYGSPRRWSGWNRAYVSTAGNLDARL
jgi:hypothetical protein